MNPAANNPQNGIHEQRKADHIRINLEEDVSFKRIKSGLEHYFFMHQALPEINLDHVETTVSLFGKQLKTPILISSMTGGTAEAKDINLTLAESAQAMGIAMGASAGLQLGGSAVHGHRWG